MEELEKRLNNVTRSYEDFVLGIMCYIDNKENRCKAVNDYLNENPNATSSEVIWFVTNQPDFFDTAYEEEYDENEEMIF